MTLQPLGRMRAAAAAAALYLLLALSAAAQTNDPYLEWYTIETPYFRVHFHGGLEELAQRTATMAEEINRRLAPDLGWTPSEVTHILLADPTDSANGSATGLPFNTIRMFVTSPDDMSVLADHDDWLYGLLVHEHTHILHVDNVGGLPALINSILGKTLVPNQVQPRWLLEGLAVIMESEHSSGGRMRSTQFDMYLRADVLEDNLAGLDELSHFTRRWPDANIWYLYGSRFLGWIADVYGPDTFRLVASDYGKNLVPWAINRSIRRATGRTYPELYEGWKHHLKRRYDAQAAAVRRRGLRAGTRLTRHGRSAANPRFVPPCGRDGDREELLYYRDDGDLPAGFYRLPLDSRSRADEDGARLVIRTAGRFRTASFDGDCGIVFDSLAPSRRRYRFNDLHRQPPGTTSPFGLRGSRERWTVGWRARYPSVSPDGRRLVYVTDSAGTSTLRIADIHPEEGLTGERALVPSARHEQAFSPRFSPDGRRIAYSAWTWGGHRNIRIVDVESGRFSEVTADRALDQQPTWSPDGRFLFFTSDRTGIPNVYAYEIEAQRLFQVTNVLGGAYMPELSPDGRTLFYVGYTAAGFDLFSMPLRRSRWLDAPPPPADRPEPRLDPAHAPWPVKPYSPLPTLRPRALDLEYGPGTFGQSLTLRARGSDIIGNHSVAGAVTFQTELAQPVWSADYAYARLPFTFQASLFRNVVPRSDERLSEEPLALRESILGATTGLSFTLPGELDSQQLAVSYTVSARDLKVPVPPPLDPFGEAPQDDFQNFLAVLRFSWRYGATQRSLYGISTERGFTLSLAADVARPETGSEATLTAFTGRATGFVPMPWHPHHVLALAASGGTATGTFPRRGFFFTGGFADTNPVDDFTDFMSGVRQSGFVLRGFAPGQFVGRSYNLYNLEYRFPIAYVDRGVSTLPAFFRTLSATAFADYGGAFNRIDLDDPLSAFHLGVGGELWLDLALGYFITGTVRIGWAKGFGESAIPGSQTYIVVASAF